MAFKGLLFFKAYCSCSFEVCRLLPNPHPGFWGGAALFYAPAQALTSCVEEAAVAAVSGGGLMAGDTGTQGCSEWEGALRLSLLGALRTAEKSLVSHPVLLLCHLVLGDILPVQGFHSHGAGCDAVRQWTGRMSRKRDERAGAFPFVAVLTPSRLLLGSPSVGVSGAAWLTSPARAGGRKLDLPRACQARNVWAVKEQSPTWCPLRERLSGPRHDGAQCFSHSVVCS